MPFARLVSGGTLLRTPDPPPVETPHDEVMRLFTAHGPSLYRFCLFVAHHQQDAEDVVQDTFVKLLEHFTRGGDRSNVRSWLFTVAANGCRDKLRRRRSWLPWRSETDTRAIVADADVDQEARERRLALQDAAKALSPRDRLLLMLRVQGLSYREIAAGAGVPEASVGKLLARARLRWKEGYQRVYGDRS